MKHNSDIHSYVRPGDKENKRRNTGQACLKDLLLQPEPVKSELQGSNTRKFPEQLLMLWQIRRSFIGCEAMQNRMRASLRPNPRAFSVSLSQSYFQTGLGHKPAVLDSPFQVRICQLNLWQLG